MIYCAIWWICGKYDFFIHSLLKTNISVLVFCTFWLLITINCTDSVTFRYCGEGIFIFIRGIILLNTLGRDFFCRPNTNNFHTVSRYTDVRISWFIIFNLALLQKSRTVLRHTGFLVLKITYCIYDNFQ